MIFLLIKLFFPISSSFSGFKKSISNRLMLKTDFRQFEIKGTPEISLIRTVIYSVIFYKNL